VARTAAGSRRAEAAQARRVRASAPSSSPKSRSAMYYLASVFRVVRLNRFGIVRNEEDRKAIIDQAVLLRGTASVVLSYAEGLDLSLKLVAFSDTPENKALSLQIAASGSRNSVISIGAKDSKTRLLLAITEMDRNVVLRDAGTDPATLKPGEYIALSSKDIADFRAEAQTAKAVSLANLDIDFGDINAGRQIAGSLRDLKAGIERLKGVPLDRLLAEPTMVVMSLDLLITPDVSGTRAVLAAMAALEEFFARNKEVLGQRDISFRGSQAELQQLRAIADELQSDAAAQSTYPKLLPYVTDIISRTVTVESGQWPTLAPGQKMGLIFDAQKVQFDPAMMTLFLRGAASATPVAAPFAGQMTDVFKAVPLSAYTQMGRAEGPDGTQYVRAEWLTSREFFEAYDATIITKDDIWTLVIPNGQQANRWRAFQIRPLDILRRAGEWLRNAVSYLAAA